MYLLEDVVSTPDFSGLITALQTAITPAQLLTILGSVIGVGMTFVLMWFGVRKIIRIFSSALQRGKLRV
jgi:hypothetical protein